MEYVDAITILKNLLIKWEATVQDIQVAPCDAVVEMKRQIASLKLLLSYFEKCEETHDNLYKKYSDKKDHENFLMESAVRNGWSALAKGYQSNRDMCKIILNDIASLDNELDFLQHE